MQLHFCPHAARIKRDLDAAEHFPGTSLAPEVIKGRMRRDNLRQICLLIARKTGSRKAIDETVLIPPVAGKEIARDAAVIGAGAIEVRQTVVRGNTCERRWRERRHKPL